MILCNTAGLTCLFVKSLDNLGAWFLLRFDIKPFAVLRLIFALFIVSSTTCLCGMEDEVVSSATCLLGRKQLYL